MPDVFSTLKPSQPVARRSAKSRVVTPANASLVTIAACLIAGCGGGDKPAADVAAPATGSATESTAAAVAPAYVLGNAVSGESADEIQQTILDALFADYRKRNGIDVTDAEIDAFVESLARGEAADPASAGDEELTEAEQSEVNAMRREMGRSMITQWKTNRALFEQYGGRVIGQQFGPEPLDAYRQYLEEQQAAGNLSFNDAATETAFWRYFRDESMHDFLSAEAAASAFATPPWEQL